MLVISYFMESNWVTPKSLVISHFRESNWVTPKSLVISHLRESNWFTPKSFSHFSFQRVLLRYFSECLSFLISDSLIGLLLRA